MSTTRPVLPTDDVAELIERCLEVPDYYRFVNNPLGDDELTGRLIVEFALSTLASATASTVAPDPNRPSVLASPVRLRRSRDSGGRPVEIQMERNVRAAAARTDEVLALCCETGKMAGNHGLDAGKCDELIGRFRLQPVHNTPFFRQIAWHCQCELYWVAHHLRAVQQQTAQRHTQEVGNVCQFVGNTYLRLLSLRLKLGALTRQAAVSDEETSAIAREVAAVRQLAERPEYDRKHTGMNIADSVIVHLTRAHGFVQEGDLQSAHSALKEATAG